MTEAIGGGGRAEIERRLVERGLEDASFRQKLLADPRAAIEDELETRLPEEVRVVEETAETIYLVLPPATSRAAEQGKGELSDRELETVPAAGVRARRAGAILAVGAAPHWLRDAEPGQLLLTVPRPEAVSARRIRALAGNLAPGGSFPNTTSTLA
jgi:hypothetical protein